MTSRLIWSDRAKADLNDFIDHYAPLDLVFAESVSTKAVAAGRFLALYPHAGQKIGDKSLRKWPVTKTPILLIYDVVGNKVEIIRFVHNRSDWHGFA